MHRLLDKLYQIMPYLFDIKTLKAIVMWPKFSIASYVCVTHLYKLGIHPCTVIDVGANIGQFTIAAVNIFNGTKIHAFEPLPDCAEKLRKLTSNFPDIVIHNLAIGNRKGNSDFYVNAYSQASSLMRLDKRNCEQFKKLMEIKTIRIEVDTLDAIFKNKLMEKPVLLKIDVQGGEKFVLDGGRETLKQVDHVLLEMSFTKMYVGEPSFLELIDEMKELQFDFVRPINFLKNSKSGEILQADVLFTKARI